MKREKERKRESKRENREKEFFERCTSVIILTGMAPPHRQRRSGAPCFLSTLCQLPHLLLRQHPLWNASAPPKQHNNKEQRHTQPIKMYFCTDNTSPYARTRTFSRCARSHARCDHTFGSRLDDLCVCFKSHFIIGHVFVECSFDPVSSYSLITYCHTDATYCLTNATDWNQIKPLCNSALGWTVWPPGRSDPKHRL